MSTPPWEIERTVGEDLHANLSRILFRSLADAILEMTSNSWDADATTVRIDYNERAGTFSHYDDGEGMGSLEKIRGFYRRGGSTKSEQRRTAKGRIKIGKFGLGASLLQYLAEVYHLETEGDGHKVVIDEDFRQTKGRKKVPHPIVTPTAADQHGTTILLRELRFLQERKKLDLEELTERISREMPMQDDFKVQVNGKLVVPTRLEDADLFFIDTQVPGVGSIWGEVYLSSTKLHRGGGVYLKVNGRAVGDPMQFFNVGAKAVPGSVLGMGQRVIGFVHADGLDPYIGFDRTRFEEDHPKVLAVREKISDLLGIIRRNYDSSVEEERKTRGKAGLETVAKRIEARFNRSDKDFLQHGRCEFILCNEEGEKYPVEIDLDVKKVKIYTAHPYFIGLTHTQSFHAGLTSAVAFALARKRMEVRRVPLTEEMDRAFDRAYRIFHQTGTPLNEVLFGKLQVSAFDQPQTIEPSRLYQLEDLAQRTRLDQETLRSMIRAGLFAEPVHKPTLVDQSRLYIEGRTVQQALKEIEGHKLLIQIVRDTFTSLPTEDHLEFVEDLTDVLKSDPAAGKLAKDIGVLESFYVVPESRVGLFTQYLQAAGISGAKKRTYGTLRQNNHHLVLFSLRVPRKERENPQTFYGQQMQFLVEYQQQDTGSRTNLYYLADQRRILGVTLSFDQPNLTRRLRSYGFEQQDSIPAEIFTAEFPKLRMMGAGQHKFTTHTETPKLYQRVLIS